LPGLDGSWVPINVTVHRVALDKGMFAGLISVRLPTDTEMAEANRRGPS
jgi:hypothetical protein